MKKIIAAVLTSVLSLLSFGQPETCSVSWILDRRDSVGGYTAMPWSTCPTIVETPQGKAAFFDGVGDGMLLDCNPLSGAASFTIEVVFRPDSSMQNNEQRYIHIQNAGNDNRRILLELRLLPDQHWIFDTFIKSDSSRLTLLDSAHEHTTGEWHHVALIYGDGIMTQYVDGIKQLSGPVSYLPMDAKGKTSIGVRQDRRSWFKGAIRMVKFTNRALDPSAFSLPAGTCRKK